MMVFEKNFRKYTVTSRKGRVSRNYPGVDIDNAFRVTSRKGRVSRNIDETVDNLRHLVTSRKGRVSRNCHSCQVLL